MTDKEKLIEIFSKLKDTEIQIFQDDSERFVKFESGPSQPMPKSLSGLAIFPTMIVLDGGFGYAGLYVEFVFDSLGNLIEHPVLE